MLLVTSGLAPQPRAPTLGLKCPSLLCIPSCPQIPGRAKGQRCSRHRQMPGHMSVGVSQAQHKEGE